MNIFNRKHNNNPAEFYFDVLHHLLNNQLCDTECEYQLYLSQRGSNTLHRFEKAVEKTLQANEAKTKGQIKYKLQIVPSKEMPELSIIDYLMWAVQRKVLTGETRYFDALKDKYETLIDLYDGEEQE